MFLCLLHSVVSFNCSTRAVYGSWFLPVDVKSETWLVTRPLSGAPCWSEHQSVLSSWQAVSSITFILKCFYCFIVPVAKIVVMATLTGESAVWCCWQFYCRCFLMSAPTRLVTRAKPGPWCLLQRPEELSSPPLFPHNNRLIFWLSCHLLTGLAKQVVGSGDEDWRRLL